MGLGFILTRLHYLLLSVIQSTITRLNLSIYRIIMVQVARDSKRVSLAQLVTTVDFSGEGTEFNPCCQQGIFSKVANSGIDRGELPPWPAS